MDEILSRDQNHVTVLGGVTDDSNRNIVMLRVDPVTKRLLISAIGIPGSGTVTSVSVVTANGFAGSVANSTTTPAITIRTTITGLLKGNGTAISAAVAGTDYLVNITGLVTAGSNVTVTGTGTAVDPYVISASNSTAYNTIENVGVAVTQRTTINLTSLLTATDVSSKTQLDINVVNLANNTTFVNTLTNNSTFITNINNSGTLSINLATQVTGVLPVANGGTGASTLTGILKGNGTSPVTATAIAQGDLFYGSAANTLTALAKNASATRYLSNQGTSNNPSWNQVNLTNGVTGTLPFGNGGTGLSTWTQYLIPYAATTTSIGQIPIGTAGQVLTSNGAGASASFQSVNANTSPVRLITTVFSAGAGDTLLDIKYDSVNRNYYALVQNFQPSGPITTLTVYKISQDAVSSLWYIFASRQVFNISGNINFGCMAIDSTTVYVMCNHSPSVENDLAQLPLDLSSTSNSPITIGGNTLSRANLFSDGISLWFFATNGTEKFIQYDIIGATFNQFTISGFSASNIYNIYVDIGNSAAYGLGGFLTPRTFTVSGGAITLVSSNSYSLANGSVSGLGSIYGLGSTTLQCIVAYGDGYLQVAGGGNSSNVVWSGTLTQFTKP